MGYRRDERFELATRRVPVAPPNREYLLPALVAALSRAHAADSNLANLRQPDDRRFLLALGESFGASPIGVNAGKLLAIVIEDHDFPMTVLSSSVCGLESAWLHWLFFHVSLLYMNPRHSAWPAALAQVSTQ